MRDRYDELEKLSLEDLEAEINFYTFIVNNQLDLGVKESQLVWYEALKIEIKRRGLRMEKRIKLVRDMD
jgi:hypothetical protein